jgi:hypothetical protein
MVRRIAHTAHHRGEQTTLLRMLDREVYSVYGPSIDTGGGTGQWGLDNLCLPGHTDLD